MSEPFEALWNNLLEWQRRCERAEARVAELADKGTLQALRDANDRAERAEARVAELEEQLEITKGINAMRHDLTDPGAQERRMERLADRMRDEKHKETLGTELSGALDLAARAERAEAELKAVLEVCVGVDKVASIEEEIGFSKDWTPMWRDTVTRARAALAPSPVAVVAAIQSACQHERVREYPQVIDGNRFYMRQCEDCGMFNPPASAARDHSQDGKG